MVVLRSLLVGAWDHDRAGRQSSSQGLTPVGSLGVGSAGCGARVVVARGRVVHVQDDDATGRPQRQANPTPANGSSRVLGGRRYIPVMSDDPGQGTATARASAASVVLLTLASAQFLMTLDTSV